MTLVTNALKKSFALIGTGTVVASAYAVATGASFHPVACLGTGAMMGLGIFMACHLTEKK